MRAVLIAFISILCASLMVCAGPMDGKSPWADHRQFPTLGVQGMIDDGYHIWANSPLPEKKLMVVIVDGPLKDGRLLSDVLPHYSDPYDLVNESICDLFVASHGHVRFTVVDVKVIPRLPARKFNGKMVRMSLDEYCRRLKEGDFDGMDTDSEATIQFLKDEGLLDKARKGEFDELWVIGGHVAYQWEAAMCGPHPLWINGTPAVATNCPHFAILGINAERDVSELLHNHFHRWENVMPAVYSSDRWKIGWKHEWSYSWQHAREASNAPPYSIAERQKLYRTAYNLWEQYAAIDVAMCDPKHPDGNRMSAVGDCHYPVNAEGGYDYGNLRPVYSNYQYFREPFLKLNDEKKPEPWVGAVGTNVNVFTWTGEMNLSKENSHRSFIVWAYANMPHGPGMHRNMTAAACKGQTPDYVLNNWWCYFAGHDQYVEPIQALRRSGRTAKAFPEPKWKYSTADYMRKVWSSIGICSNSYTVRVKPQGKGTVSGSGAYVYGTTAVLEASPAAVSWKVGTRTLPGGQRLCVCMTNDMRVTVQF